MKNIVTIYLLLCFMPFNGNSQVENFDSFQQKFDKLLNTYVEEGKVDYAQLQDDKLLDELVQFISTANTSKLESSDLLAFRINAYNAIVLHSAVKEYPLSSVQEITGFFDQQKHTIENKSYTLNRYEKENILRIFNDPRLHFVLNCGAVSCPPLIDQAYDGKSVYEQLEVQTVLGLDDPEFLIVEGDQLKLSQIFNWYASDFGGSKKTIINFINQYKSEPVPDNSSISYYDYDWTLNGKTVLGKEGKSNASNRYVVSSTIPKGRYELKFFNNLYSQEANDERNTFFTTAFSALYGLNGRFNIGLAGRFRAVSNHVGDSSPFDVVGFRNTTSDRIGLTALGPIIRYAPVPKWKNFSIQSTLTFPIGKNLAGIDNKPYIDWNGAFFNTQLFNDFTLNSKFSLFTELDFLLEDIGFNVENSAYRFSTPVTVIFSYFPTSKATIYSISGFSPYWQQTFDYFYQIGAGTKYQFTPDFELELLYTAFRSKGLIENNGSASTYNFGIRYNL